MRKPAISLVILAAALLIAPAVASGGQIWTAGHGDVGIGYEGSAWDLHVHLEGATLGGVADVDGEFEPDEVDIFISDASSLSRPAGSAWDFIGAAAGETFWRAPQGLLDSVNEGAPYVGLGTEEIAGGTFVSNQITVSLESVSGPGTFSLYKDGPTDYLSTVGDSFLFPTGGHDHFNWAFSDAGIYQVTLGATGDLVAGGTTPLGTGTYTFRVGNQSIPEPSSIVGLTGLAVCGLVTMLRRRRSK